MSLLKSENIQNIMTNLSTPNSLHLTRKKKKHSLNEMILASLAAVQEQEKQVDSSATARDITDYIQQTYDIQYPIQTIIVVLNRLVKKGIVTRVSNTGEDVRHRYSFYLNQSPTELREERINRRFKAFADEFYGGDLELAVHEAQKMLLQSKKSS